LPDFSGIYSPESTHSKFKAFPARRGEVETATQEQESSLPAQSVPAREPVDEARGFARVFRSFRHRDFAVFWSGNFLSNIGTWMQTVALGWLVLEITDSAWMVGVNGFVSAAPTLLFTLIGGAIADRVDRRRLMLVMQSGMLALALLLGTLTLLEKIDLRSILVIAFLSGLAMAINYPAYQALYPELVEEEDLLNAVALNSAQFNIARAVGPTVAGLALGTVGVAACFYLNAVSFLGLIVALLIIRPPQFIPHKGGSVWQAMREGFGFVGERRLILLLLSVSGFLSLFGLPFVILMPVFARDLLGVGASGLGYLMGGNRRTRQEPWPQQSLSTERRQRRRRLPPRFLCHRIGAAMRFVCVAHGSTISKTSTLKSPITG